MRNSIFLRITPSSSEFDYFLSGADLYKNFLKGSGNISGWTPAPVTLSPLLKKEGTENTWIQSWGPMGPRVREKLNSLS